LLTYAMPRIDVNPVAHELINKFGSLANVFDASYEELQDVQYITENGAVLIKLIPEISKLYQTSRLEHGVRFFGTSDIVEYLYFQV